LEESIKVAEAYLEQKDWNIVKTLVVEDNLLQKNTVYTRKKLFKELTDRLKTLPDHLLSAIPGSPLKETKLILFLAICRTYRYIADFTVEVLRSKVLLFDTRLTDLDYQRFFEGKFDHHPEMHRLTAESLKNVKHKTFSILSQAELVQGKGERCIQIPLLSKSFMQAVCLDNSNWLKVFLMSDADIEIAKRKFT
jgi:hypothetical protein